MAKLLQAARDVPVPVWYQMYWERTAGGSGYSFPCTVDGVLITDGLCDAALANIRLVDSHPEQFRSPRINRYGGGFRREHAVYECDCCHAPVECDRFTNTCDCGADYNMSGQRLADRSQWFDGTDECMADIAGL